MQHHSSPPASSSVPSELPLERLEAEITELAAHIYAATCRWLLLIAELDRREGWAGWGVRSCAHWLNWRCGLSLIAARQHVRVARALGHLPRTTESFAKGELSYSKVRAITRVGTPENEEELLAMATHGTAAHLERVVSAYRGVLDAQDLEEANDRHEKRILSWHYDDDGSLLIRGRLDPEEGAVVVKALEAAARSETDPEDDPAGSSRSREPAEGWGAVHADALVRMAESFLASGPGARTGGERTQVVLHVEAEALATDAEGRCGLEDDPRLHPETARRLGCDASVVAIVEADGEPLSVGRRTRTIPPSLRRALSARDGGCRFPSCTQTRFVEGHHVRHWAHGGETSLSNLTTLCKVHHRAVHEGGFGLENDGHGAFTFRRPDGGVIADAPLPPTGDRATLLRGNAHLGIGPGTCESRWGGERLDLAMAIDGLVQADGLMA